MSIVVENAERIDWQKNAGLIPVIVQHALNGSVLMLGYMDSEALRLTLERGRVVFFSRSRQRLWEKGETSGHTLELRSARLDCDADTLLLSAIPAGPVCHTGSLSCFGNKPLSAVTDLSFLAELEQIITQRAGTNPQGSYSARLLQSGVKRVAQKLGEEGLEVALAACVEDDAALLGECADLLYHLLVLLRARSLSLAQVIETLRARHAQGLEQAR
jgi:phosphoribosyl-ATP pyrophosphohydrolase/phosphoribosyl-AMP cyclohydrolase